MFSRYHVLYTQGVIGRPTQFRFRTACRRATQGGNTFIETSLVLLVLLVIIFAIIDFSLAVYVRSTLLHAVREGVRFAVTYQTVDGQAHDASIKTVVQRAAIGLLREPQHLERIRIRYYDPLTLTEVPHNTPGNLVEIAIEDYPWTWIIPLSRSATPLRYTVRSSDRMEGLPGGVQPPAR